MIQESDENCILFLISIFVRIKLLVLDKQASNLVVIPGNKSALKNCC